jgi:hypothetical protein
MAARPGRQSNRAPGQRITRAGLREFLPLDSPAPGALR